MDENYNRKRITFFVIILIPFLEGEGHDFLQGQASSSKN